MKIGVVSDTHTRDDSALLLEEMIDRLARERVGLIFHAGDICDQAVLDKLGAVAEVKAVAGNIDPPELKARLPNRLVTEVEGVRIGLIHGSGPPTRLGERLLPSFDGDDIDVLVFGHSHVPQNNRVKAGGREDGVLLFNPGSLGSNRDGSPPTFGILTVGGGRISGKIVRIG